MQGRAGSFYSFFIYGIVKTLRRLEKRLEKEGIEQMKTTEETAAEVLSRLEKWIEHKTDDSWQAISADGRAWSSEKRLLSADGRTLSSEKRLPRADERGNAPSLARPLLLAIDGRCGSGKTTLAAALQERLHCGVFHMDDFYLPFEARTPERLAQPGGHMDFDRFEKEVLRPLRGGSGAGYYEKKGRKETAGKGSACARSKAAESGGRTAETPLFFYRPYDCMAGRMGEPVPVFQRPLYVVEGSYCCHPQLFSYYDFHIFLTVSHQEQRARILRRSGPARAAMFDEVWIPREEAYFAAYDVEARCELRAET